MSRSLIRIPLSFRAITKMRSLLLLLAFGIVVECLPNKVAEPNAACPSLFALLTFEQPASRRFTTGFAEAERLPNTDRGHLLLCHIRWTRHYGLGHID